jgi:polar amino acid transport system substrate-binding protein
MIRFAHQDRFPPFVELQAGKSRGLFVDILRAVAARAGIEVEFVPVPFEQVQRTLEDGRAQAIFPLAITAERRQIFDFSVPFLSTGGALYVRAPNPTPEGFTALAGKVVVTPRTGPLAAFIQKTAPEVKLVDTADYEESLARLVSGEAEAAALNFQVGARLAAKLYPGKLTVPATMFSEAPLAIGVQKGRNSELLARLDAGLSAIKADGTWQQINNRWMGR